MGVSVEQRAFGWLILIICLVAVPVSFIAHQDEADKTETETGSKKLRSILSGGDRLVVVKINDVIVGDDRDSIFSGRNTANSALKRLRKIIDDDHVKGMLFRINSPGGTVATSQEIHGLVKQIKEQKKPVVVSMGDIAASGGYYVACAADKIVADPGTLTGSIGVIINLVNLQEIEKKIGIKPEVVKSGKFKDIGSPNKPLSPEEREILTNLIMDSYGQFVKAVAAGRGMKEDKVRELADGRIYSGSQAKELGLVDELGGYDEALATLQKLSKKQFKHKKDLPVDDKSGFGALSELLESVSSPMTQPRGIGSLVPPFMQARYLNQPLWVWQ